MSTRRMDGSLNRPSNFSRSQSPLVNPLNPQRRTAGFSPKHPTVRAHGRRLSMNASTSSLSGAQSTALGGGSRSDDDSMSPSALGNALSQIVSSGFHSPPAHGENGEDFTNDTDSFGRSMMGPQLSGIELANIERTFMEFDEDGSGTMDMDELKTVMEAMGHMLTTEQIQELVDQVDTSGNGVLDLNDFVQLILLWKEANQFKLFDSGAPSIQEQRINDARRTRMLMSDGQLKLAWDFFMHMVVLYLWCNTLYFDLINRERFLEWQWYLLALDIVVSLTLVADVVFTGCTAVRLGNKTLLDDPKKIWQWYAKTWLLVDVYAILPYGHMGRSAFPIILNILRLTKAAKLATSFRYSGRRHMTAFYVTFRLNVMPLVRRLMAFLMVTMLLSVMWTLLREYGPKFDAHQNPTATMTMQDSVNSSSSNATTANESSKEPAATQQCSNNQTSCNTSSLPSKSNDGGAAVSATEAPAGQQTITAARAKGIDFNSDWTTGMFFVMYTLTTCGYGSVVVAGPYEQLFACALSICGTLLQGLVIGIIVSIIQKTDISSERGNKLRETLAVCEYFDIPVSLQNEILQFQDHVLSHNLSQAYTDLVRGLPLDMQLNINLFVKIRLVSDVPFFHKAHQGTLVAIAQHLEQMVFLPEQYIVISGDEGDAMYFLSFGFVDVVSNAGVQVATLKQGDFFGEMALLSPNALRTASVKALTYCDVFELCRDAFSQVLARFPKFKQEMLAMAEKRRNELPQTPTTTNLLAPPSPPEEEPVHPTLEPLDDDNDKDGVNKLINSCFEEMNALELSLNVRPSPSSKAGASSSGGSATFTSSGRTERNLTAGDQSSDALLSSSVATMAPPPKSPTNSSGRRRTRTPSIILVQASPEEQSINSSSVNQAVAAPRSASSGTPPPSVE